MVQTPNASFSLGQPDKATAPAAPTEPDTTAAVSPLGLPDPRNVEGSWTSPTPAQELASAVSSSASDSLEDVVARVLPAVVSIQAGRGRGTGFFIRPALVLTNAHVVGDQMSVQLTAGDKQYSARVSTVSTSSDLALLQVYGTDAGQPTLRLGSAKGLRAGQEVIAIGSALGVLSNTATRGIVSAVRDTSTVTLIQTDAAINPGNSGGPLVDRTGVVIGVNSMRIAATQGGEGLAFAVAIDHALQLLGGHGHLGRRDAAAGTEPADERRLSGRRLARAGRAGVSKGPRGSGTAGRPNRHLLGPLCQQLRHQRGARRRPRVVRRVRAQRPLRIAGTSGYDCIGWLGTLRTRAEVIRAEVAKATEAARRQGVYPGIMRDLRRQHRMEWRGWER